MKRMKTLCGGLLALLLCIALPSCSDDDDENNHAQTEQEAQRGMLELLNLKMNLCLVNLKGEPTKATFGVAMSEANKTERIYYTKDLESAKKRFQLLFHSDTKCSADGCTYTLANKQGTATFAAGSGNKGELAVATFDVPGLKGLVTKVHFIDYTQRGENSTTEEFDNLFPTCIVNVRVNDTDRCAIALGPLKGSDDTWVLFTPSIQTDLDNYRPTGFIDQSMIQDGSEEINIMDYIQSLDEIEFSGFFFSLWEFLYNEQMQYSDATANRKFVEMTIGIDYWDRYWERNSFYFQVKKEDSKTYPDSTDPQNGTTQQVFNRYHMLLNYNGYDSRNSLWNLSTTVITGSHGVTTNETKLPEEFFNAVPLWTTISTVSRGDFLIIYD